MDEPTEFITVHRGDLGGAIYRDPATEDLTPLPATEDAPGHDRDDRDGDRDDQHDEHDETHADGQEADERPEPRKLGTGAAIVRTAGEVMVTLGLVMLLFVVYEVWVTDLISAGKQEDVTVALDEQWQHPTDAGPERQERFQFAEGQGMAKLYIPALGEDYKFTVVEGTSERDLEIGPGHYAHSALPGQAGNFAVAGHRVGKGAPFNDLDLIQACDAIVVETETHWYVYRLLPTPDDARDWAAKAADPRCAGSADSAKVEPLGGEYAAAVGRQIVSPSQSEVVAPVPGNAKATTPPDQRKKMITLTTCHPKFSNRQRMILQGIMVREQAKNPADQGAVPAELRETG
ncbi:class E sortase [Actinokineospora enzanensis]|uniref:class E sortase n=1 Tax=Actinokineospora enzanensis TaxID=155975 RepID=UPI0003623D90|nr:class E sortase [Actinokineospora enzanensis]